MKLEVALVNVYFKLNKHLGYEKTSTTAMTGNCIPRAFAS